MCFYLFGIPGPVNGSLNGGLIGGDHAPTNALLYLLVLVPAICYLVGGRVAARVARARRVGDAFVAGALMALPLSLLLGLAALAASATDTQTLSGNGGAATFSSTQGPTFGSTLLAVLVVGAVVGGIGGASIVLAPWLGKLPRLLMLPSRPLGWPLFLLLDRLTARPAGQQRSEAIRWLYDGVLAALLVGIASIIWNALAGTLSTSLPLAVVAGVNGVLAAVLVGLPLLFFTGALVTAFTTPLLSAPQTIAQEPVAVASPGVTASLPTLANDAPGASGGLPATE